MNGLTMDYQLTIPAILRRAEQLHGRKGIATRRPDKSMYRYTCAEMVERAKRLAVALAALGVADGDRVATLCWNHHEHLEAYFGIPSAGAVLHTLNLRLHPDDQTYIVGNAGDKALLVDDVLLPVFEKFRDRVDIGHVIVIPTSGAPVPDSMLDYEKLLAAADPAAFVYRAIDERQAAAMCYTSGTTGKPKGVLYSHRCIALHSMGSAQRDVLDVGESDVVLPVVPMFHANAWGLPFTATLTGATQVFPGQHLDATSLLELFQDERVTMTAGVPTIWFGILQTLTPLGTVARVTSDLQDAPPEEQYAYRATQGRPAPFIEIRARSEDGLVPWDGEAMGELEVRGPWVASAYYNNPGPDDRFTDDGWFRTGDIVTIDARGYVTITDRAKDVVKSGGEWISTVALENALMAHPAVLEAAVIAVPHPKWDERPLACVVLKEGEQATAEDLLALLQSDFAKFWIPDGVEFIDEIPHTATGKFLKTALRERYRDYAARSSQ